VHVSPGPPSSGEVRERLQAPEVVELPIAEVLQNGEEEQASGFPSARVGRKLNSSSASAETDRRTPSSRAMTKNASRNASETALVAKATMTTG
jgi:hypothetical protein